MTTDTDHNSKNKIPSGDITEVQSKEGTVSVQLQVSDDEAFKTNLSNSSHLLADMNASPLHLHVTTVEGALLQGKPPVPSSIISHGSGRSSRSRSNSRTRARSRSRDATTGRLDGSQSPSIVSVSGCGYGSASSSRRNSCSSIEDIEPDILTDKMGHEELTPGSCASSVSTLHTVNERMSEDALEDCHAFTDLKDVIRQIQATHSGSGEGQGQGQNQGLHSIGGIGTGTSSRNSVNGGSIMEDPGHLLETLEEFEEGEEDDEMEEDDNQDQPQDQPQTQPQDNDRNHNTTAKKRRKPKVAASQEKENGCC
jgi:hypothetical protein